MNEFDWLFTEENNCDWLRLVNKPSAVSSETLFWATLYVNEFSIWTVHTLETIVASASLRVNASFYFLACFRITAELLKNPNSFLNFSSIRSFG